VITSGPVHSGCDTYMSCQLFSVVVVVVGGGD
jgi:hypothetical protein